MKGAFLDVYSSGRIREGAQLTASFLPLPLAASINKTRIVT